MRSDEPILLYANNAAGFSLLSWRLAASGTLNYLALPGPDRRRSLRLQNKASGEGGPAFEEELKRYGGLWTRIDSSSDQRHLITKSNSLDGYVPPNKLVVLGAGGNIEHRYISPSMSLNTQDFVLLPVDMASQNQLEYWINGLTGLPGDLREATLQSIVNEGVLDLLGSRKLEQLADPVPDKKTVPLWAWLLLTALLGIGVGAAGYNFLPGLLASSKTIPSNSTKEKSKSPKPTTPDKTNPISVPKPAVNSDQTSGPTPEQLGKFEGALKENLVSKQDLKGLVESHTAPFQVPPIIAAAGRNAEAWMVVKLVMLKTKESKVDLTWSKNSNQKATDFLTAKFNKLPPEDHDAIAMAFCVAALQLPVENPPQCSNQDWGKAPELLENLGKSAIAATVPVHTNAPTPKKKESAK